MNTLEQLVEEFSTSKEPEIRKTCMVILDTKRQAFHFCETKLQGEDIWFVVNAPLFDSIERIMTLNNVAHNIAHIKKIRTCGASEDWQITYNAKA